jgi:hypothetical protein
MARLCDATTLWHVVSVSNSGEEEKVLRMSVLSSLHGEPAVERVWADSFCPRPCIFRGLLVAGLFDGEEAGRRLLGPSCIDATDILKYNRASMIPCGWVAYL